MAIRTGGGTVVTSTRVSSATARPAGYGFPVGLTFLGTATNNVVVQIANSVTWVCPAGVTSVDYLVIAGGGSGGNNPSTNGNGAGGTVS